MIRLYLPIVFLLLVCVDCFSQMEQITELLNAKGQSVTTVDHTTIARYYGRTLAALLNDQPGIIVNGAFQPMGSLVVIYMEGTLGGRALVLLDGVPVYDPSSLSDFFDLNFISIYDIERIDIYHETHGSTMGNGAFAGAINIITHKKDNNKPIRISAIQSFGNEGTSNTNMSLNASKNKWRCSVNYSRIKTDGFSLAHDSIGNQNFDNDWFNSNSLNTHLQYLANTNLTVNTYCLYSHYKAASDADVFFDTRDYFYNKKLLNTGLGFSYNKNNLLVVGNYHFDETSHNYHYDYQNHENYLGRSHYVELYAQTPVASAVKFLFGVDYRNNYMKSWLTDTTTITSYNYPKINLYSFYSKLIFNKKDSLTSFEIAARETHQPNYGFVSSYNLSGSYKLNKNIHLFGGIATGFKLPCLFQLYNKVGLANDRLTPEKTIDYHFGIAMKQNNLSHKLRLYYNNLTNLIYFDSNVGTYDNFSKQKTWGLQYELAWKLNDNFNVTTNYTLTKGLDYSDGHSNGIDTITYHYLFRRPEHVVNVGINYSGKHFDIALSARYVSDYYDINFVMQTDQLNSHFLVVNTSAGYSVSKKSKLFVNIQNLFNNVFYDVAGLNSIPFLINGGIEVNL